MSEKKSKLPAFRKPSTVTSQSSDTSRSSSTLGTTTQCSSSSISTQTSFINQNESISTDASSVGSSSSSSRRSSTDSEKSLVEKICEIRGDKLPSNRQVIGYFSFLRDVNKNMKTREIAAIVGDEITRFYRNANNIPTITPNNVVEKIVRCYKTFVKTKQAKSRRVRDPRPAEVIDMRLFISNLDNLFDISREDALNEIKDENTKIFLQNQRLPGRIGQLQILQ